MNLEDIVLSEISQTQMINAVSIHFSDTAKIGKFIETEGRIEFTRNC